MTVHRFRSPYLLASLVLLILVSPFFEGTRVSRFVVEVLYTLVLLTSVHVASDRPRIRIFAAVSAILAMLLMWSNADDPASTGRIAGLLFFVALNSVTIGLVLQRIVTAAEVDFEVLCAGIANYLLLGVTWALTYLVMDAVNPDAFMAVSSTVEQGWTDFVYFSFATLTTLGYGDISPDTPGDAHLGRFGGGCRRTLHCRPGRTAGQPLPAVTGDTGRGGRFRAS